MKKLILALAALALAFGGITASTVSASAAAPGDILRIVRVGTDAMGTDNIANRNREYVTIKNVSTGPVDIDGVVVEDNWSHGNRRSHGCNKYTISDLPGQGTSAVLQANEYVTVYNGSRFGGDYRTTEGEYRLYANSDVDCGTAGHYLNNDADTVWLSKGDVTDSKSWDWDGGYYVFGRR